MGFAHRYWTEIQRAWWRPSGRPRRSHKGISPIEPLEVRTLLTGEFTDVGALGIPRVLRSSVAWGDADNDGDLDILVTGMEGDTAAKIAEVYRNDGNGAFTDMDLGLTGMWTSSAAWGDADNDGDLDILMAGLDSADSPLTKVYRNNGDGTFSDLNAALAGVGSASVAWGDVDNDGDLDILLTGRDSSGAFIADVYRNNGETTFTALNCGLIGVYSGSVAWGDVDKDGDLDILLSGSTSDSSIATVATVAKVYRNNGNSTFSDLNAGLTGVRLGSAAWGDADNDGDLDILLTGEDDGSNHVAKVYRNNGDNTFTDVNAALTGVIVSAAAWGDTDNDGDLDILLTGQDSAVNKVARAYRNNGDLTFTDLNAGLTAVNFGSVACGDADNDGDLDVFVTGVEDPGFATTKLYRNNAATINTPPAAPLNLNATVASTSAIMFTWTAPADAQTPPGGLSYNLRVGTTPGGSDVFSSMTDPANGRRRVAAAGSIQGTSYTLKDLSSTTTYYWSVQAVDSTFTGGEFAAEQFALINNTASTISGGVANQPVTDTTTIAPFEGLTVTDPDLQPMTVTVTIANGANRGDFAGVSGWTRAVNATDFVYTRNFAALPNIGTTVQSALTSLVFQPRTNAITPGTTEATGFVVALNDGMIPLVSDTTTSVVTTSINDAPTIGGVVANQAVNDSANIMPFSALTIIDPDTQNLFAKVTILNGTVRGDFTAASSAGWNRTVAGNNITYSRFYAPMANIGGVVQAALRNFVFTPRNNAIKPNTTELTDIQVFLNDGIANTTATTRLTTTSVNNAPAISGASSTVTANDNATVNPFTTLTVTDLDFQETLISVTILNGKVRGDFTPASVAGWPVRYVTGNNITYKRYFSPGANVGDSVQAAFRALVFQPRQNAIKPGTMEATDFQVTVSDGVAPAIADSGTRVTTTSVNNAPTIGGGVANQTMNDNQTKAVFSTLTVADPDTQDQFVRITITGGTPRGDFTSASTTGWTRKTSGSNILYERFFSATANSGAVVQTAIRALVFQPRNNVPVGTTETTSFTVFVNDGLANVTNSTTSVITTGVAPRSTSPSLLVPPTILNSDITTLVMSSARKMSINPLARLLKKSR